MRDIGMNTLNRAAFRALDPIAKMSHIRSGGRVIDDTPVAAESTPFILDGAERLRLSESKRRWDEETARLKAEQRA